MAGFSAALFEALRAMMVPPREAVQSVLWGHVPEENENADCRQGRSSPSRATPKVFYVQDAIEQAEADQIHMARDMTMMFDELRAMADRHAELHVDRVRLQAELDQARAELARARRPWRRRLIER